MRALVDPGFAAVVEAVGSGLHRGGVLLRARRARDALASDPGRIPAGNGVHGLHGDRAFNHLDRFATAHVAFWIWVGLYVATPVLVPWAWWRNRATDPGTPEPGEPPLPGFVRPLLLAVGAVQSAVALVLVLLLSPTMIEHWPWHLTPLTAQTLGGWFALPGVTALMMGLDGRWSALRITLESQLIGLALILLGTIRAWDDVDTSSMLAYVFVAGIAGLFLALLALEWYMLGRERAGSRRTRLAPSQ